MLLITGAASGMGKISAKRLAADGIHVAAVDVNEENLNQLKQESNNISTFHCDLADANAVKEMVNEVHTQIGPIDRVTHASSNANGKEFGFRFNLYKQFNEN